MASETPEQGPAAGMSLQMQQGFERLRLIFVAGLAQRWQDIDGAVDASARRAALHALVGAAGSYGMQALCDAARAAEDCCLLDDPQASAAALLALRQALADAGVTVP